MDDGQFKTCPFCREKIRTSAIKCRYCGEWLEAPPEEVAPERAEATSTPLTEATSPTPLSPGQASAESPPFVPPPLPAAQPPTGDERYMPPEMRRKPAPSSDEEYLPSEGPDRPTVNEQSAETLRHLLDMESHERSSSDGDERYMPPEMRRARVVAGDGELMPLEGMALKTTAHEHEQRQERKQAESQTVIGENPPCQRRKSRSLRFAMSMTLLLILVPILHVAARLSHGLPVDSTLLGTKVVVSVCWMLVIWAVYGLVRLAGTLRKHQGPLLSSQSTGATSAGSLAVIIAWILLMLHSLVVVSDLLYYHELDTDLRAILQRQLTLRAITVTLASLVGVNVTALAALALSLYSWKWRRNTKGRAAAIAAVLVILLTAGILLIEARFHVFGGLLTER